MYKLRRRWFPIACSFLILGFLKAQAPAKSWEVVIDSGGQQMKWWLDEELGAKLELTDAGMPGVEMIIRFDLQKNIWINRQRGVHAIQNWGEGGMFQLPPEAQAQIDEAKRQMQQNMQNLPPEAQAYARQLMEGKLDAIPGQAELDEPAQKAFQRTGEQKQIQQWKAWSVAEHEAGQPTGRVFWVGQVDDWDKMAAVLEKATREMRAGLPMPRQDAEIPFTQLGGLPLRIEEADGTVSEIVSIKTGKLRQQHMSPAAQSSKVELMQFMMQNQPTPQDGLQR